jgi:PIN domain nuclease of toxin-antitoxin system
MIEAGIGEAGWILDASAVLALLQDESGGQLVEDHLAGAAICAVNLCEVIGKLLDVGMPDSEAEEVMAALGLEIIPFTADLAWRAAALRSIGRAVGLSLGDRACLATGLMLDRPVLGGDRVWTQLDLPIHISLIR